MGGTVGFYVPSTLTGKTTWQDSGEATPNVNPITLDALGSALIWGQGTYREILKDSGGNVIWDGLTSGNANTIGTANGILQANGSGLVTAVTIGSGLTYSGGTLSATGGTGYGSIYDVVKTYGGDPTGAADNTAAYNAAKSACASGGGGLIWFQAGTYKFTSAITDNNAGCGIVGAGPLATMLKPYGVIGNFLTINFGSSVSPTVWGNFGITPGTGWIAGYAIAGAPSFSHFHDIYMLNPPQAFLISGGAEPVIENLTVWQATSSPVIRCDGSIGTVFGATLVNGSGNTNSSAGTVIEHGSSCNTLRVHGFAVAGGTGNICYHTTAGAGIFDELNDLECDHTQVGAVFDGGTGVQITNSWFGSTLVQNGLTFSNTFTGFASVSNSHIRDNALAGVLINGSGGINITGNIISGNASGQVLIGANVSNFKIDANQLGVPGDPTAAVCVNVNTGTSDYYTVTSNTCGTTNTTGVTDNGTGVHKNVSGNIGP